MTQALIPLSRLLAEGRPPNASVSIDEECPIDWAAFTTHVGRLSAVLAPRGPGRWLVFTENTYAFAVALMAIWQADAVAVLAPNGQPGTLAELSRGTHGLITERDRVTPSLDRVVAIHGTGLATPGWIALDRTTPRLELFTSGSTGARKAVVKTLANLDDEVAGLEAQWGNVLQGREIFGTVSHQHIYGLLFRVLWPLSAGRIFRAQTYLRPEEMAVRMAHARACVLVASPAHLSRLKGFPSIARIAAHCRTVFSSGGPLDQATAVALRGMLGAAPFEVFGSTETGGVAWRQQDGGADSLSWTPFASVTVDEDPTDGLLRVRSPYVSEDGGVFTMADRVKFLAGGRFVVGPRSDRIVKIGDKRLSLPEMEEALGEHPFVTQAALVVLDQGPGARLGVAVVLTPAGRAALARQGRRAVSQELLQPLDPYWDRVVLPRVWRYVSRLPEDAQGKVTVTGLRALFASPYDSAVVTPELLAESVGDGTRDLRLRVPETLGWLDGHFPGFPVVPGVAQLQWVMEVARTMAGGAIAIERIEALKFKDVLRPGEVFQLRAELSTAGDRLVFRLSNERAVFSSGRCVLTPARLGS